MSSINFTDTAETINIEKAARYLISIIYYPNRIESKIMKEPSKLDQNDDDFFSGNEEGRTQGENIVTQ